MSQNSGASRSKERRKKLKDRQKRTAELRATKKAAHDRRRPFVLGGAIVVLVVLVGLGLIFQAASSKATPKCPSLLIPPASTQSALIVRNSIELTKATDNFNARNMFIEVQGSVQQLEQSLRPYQNTIAYKNLYGAVRGYEAMLSTIEPTVFNLPSPGPPPVAGGKPLPQVAALRPQIDASNASLLRGASVSTKNGC